MPASLSELGPPPPLPGPEASPKRRQILDSARELFLARGYGAVSMDAVAQRASVSKATLYAHFASKDELFATMMAECTMAQMLEDTLPLAPCEDLRGTLRTVGREVVRFLVSEHKLSVLRVAIAELPRFPELARAYYENGPARGLERVQAWLKVQQAAGLVRTADLRVATDQLFALFRSDLVLRGILGVPPPPAEAQIAEAVAAAVETWLRAYAA